MHPFHAFHAEDIRTPRLDLVPLRVEHADEMAAVLADPALHAFIGGRSAGPAELAARYRRLTAGSPDPTVVWLNWVVRLRDENHLTGTVQATVTLAPGAAPVVPGPAGATAAPGATETTVTPDRVEPAVLPGPAEAARAATPVEAALLPGAVAEVAWVVGAAWQGRGIASEAAGALVAWLGRRAVGTVVAHVHPAHLASAAVAARAGLTPTAETQNGETRWVLTRGISRSLSW
ncbi:GNAT family N-acetyltransferase [Streptomyces sp. NPDC026672]|uniref:GNAT family N-acetyltransferase n=1 Tax=unclassified Streptomyces TaxID=2593676 RepID=UPI0033F06333